MSSTAHAGHVNDPHDPSVGHHYTSTGLDNRKIAIWSFIGSECMLFGTLIATYLIYKGKSLVGPYPHEAWTNPQTGQAFVPILDIPVTSFSTFVLLMSSLAMVLAHNAVVHNSRRSRLWLATTAILGMVFLACQAYEFTSFVHEGLSLGTNLFGSSFYVLTGFHGAHVTAGVLWLWSMFAIDMKRKLGPDDAINVDLLALYWHFVDIVWIVIFTVVYLIS